jgi:hypothetical protein
MATSQLEIVLQDRGYGSNNVVEMSSIPGDTHSILLRVKHTEIRKDDHDADEVTWRGIEANLEELRNAVLLLESADYASELDNDKCTGCGRP